MTTQAATNASAAPRWRDYAELTKPRITLMVVLTALVGFLLATHGRLQWGLLVHTLFGTALLAGGASALNQYFERQIDARMRRTANRPLPAGRLAPLAALAFGVGLGLAGGLYLWWAVNALTAALGVATLGAYIFIYTPMKPRSNLNTLVGAVPGAIPPMMGVTAVTGELDALAWALFGILFLWQMPHFLAIAWLYRTDYRRGGLAMLPVDDARGEQTVRQMVLYAAALVPVSLLPSVLGVSGPAYMAGALLMSFAFLGVSAAFGFLQSTRMARRVVLASVAYLPLLLILMVADRAVA
ncbi:MAG TPA: heme o synthase [Alphaproteobacteria bacterium]